MAGGLSSRVLNMKFMRNALTKEQKSKISSSQNGKSATKGNNSEISDPPNTSSNNTYSSIQEKKYRWSIDGVNSQDVLKRQNKQLNKFQAMGYSGMTEFYDDSEEEEDDAGEKRLAGRIVFGKELRKTESKPELTESSNEDGKDDNDISDEEYKEQELIKSTKLVKRPSKQKKENKKEVDQESREASLSSSEQVISELFGKAEDFQNKSNVIPSVANFLNDDQNNTKHNHKRANSDISAEKKRSKNGNKNKKKKRKM